MPSETMDLERIRAVLAQATAPGAEFSQRSLSKAAGESRDCVGDIINGRNKNPTIKVLSNLATALQDDLSIFGLGQESRAAPPTEDELEEALRDMLPGMPRGSLDKRARYLAEAVGRALKLPPSRRELPAGSSIDRATDVPPRATTN
jgi:transcriptional regulator with XRE-family HTH domain